MKYLPERGLYFVHIPKCAGISVHRALDLEEASYSALAQDLGIDVPEAARWALSERFPTEPGKWPKGGFPHQKLGPIKPTHLPLSYMESDFPMTWQALRSAPHSFALIRAPRGRFFSALMQRMKEFGDAGAIRADDPKLIDEARHVCDWLSARDRFCDVEYAHFTTQYDYVYLNGEQVLTQVFPVDRTDLLSQWIQEKTELSVEIPRVHARRQPKRWGRVLQPVARTVGRTLMPYKVKKALHPLWMKSGVFTNAAATYDSVSLGDDVETFLKTYYARDFDLYERALAAAAAREKTQEPGQVTGG